MASPSKKLNAIIIFVMVVLLIFSSLPTTSAVGLECTKEQGKCIDKGKSLEFKIIAIVSILVASIICVSLPLFSSLIPALNPEKNLFVVVKAFASGVILATGYMHVLPDSYADLQSMCLPRHPWRKFPFTGFVAMLSAILTLMVDSFSMSFHKKKCCNARLQCGNNGENLENGNKEVENVKVDEGIDTTLIRNRVLEMGIVVHSVIIGLTVGASNNYCSIRPLTAALCFHQLFEGMGLGGCILQANYGMKMKAILVFFFSVTTPFGIVLGIGMSRIYSINSPTALIVEGLLNASSAGLLNYMALVDLLGADFMGHKLQANMKLQIWAYVAVISGAGLMSICPNGPRRISCLNSLRLIRLDANVVG